MNVKPDKGKGAGRWIQLILAGLLTATFSAVGSGIAHAQELNYVIDSSSDQSYTAVIERAEAMASSSIAQAFAENPRLTEIAVKVTGDRNGSLSPLLFIKVSRVDWQNRPNVQVWAQYLSDASVLLGYRSGASSTIATSRSTNAPTVPIGAVNPNSEPNFYN